MSHASASATTLRVYSVVDCYVTAGYCLVVDTRLDPNVISIVQMLWLITLDGNFVMIEVSSILIN